MTARCAAALLTGTWQPTGGNGKGRTARMLACGRVDAPPGQRRLGRGRLAAGRLRQ